MELKKGMVFVHSDSESVTIVDAERYVSTTGINEPDRVIFHGPNLKEDLVKYGWKLDENYIIDLLLEKYSK